MTLHVQVSTASGTLGLEPGPGVVGLACEACGPLFGHKDRYTTAGV